MSWTLMEWHGMTCHDSIWIQFNINTKLFTTTIYHIHLNKHNTLLYNNEYYFYYLQNSIKYNI
jgi:hypothetical protein